jgi:sulfide:quinone oxidoreductase
LVTSDAGRPTPGDRFHDVVIVGGGNAGISLAARLRRDGCPDVAVVDPVQVHRYRPLLSYVGGGQARMSELERPQADVIPRGVHWYPERVLSVEPTTRTVHTDTGRRLTAGDLVLCPGAEPDWGDVPGSREAVFSAAGASNYVDERASHTWELVSGLRSGRAVFVVSAGPVPCAGVGLKPLFLAADHWRRTGVLADIEINAVLGWDTIFGLERVDAELRRAAERYGVRVVTGARLSRVDPGARTVSYRRGDDDVELAYDLLHLVPRHRAPTWVQESDLALTADHASVPTVPASPTASIGGRYGDVVGMIDVSPTTLAHRRHDQVWGLGDAANVRASRSGGALRKQAAVVADNIARSRTGRPLVDYTGYSTAPVTVSRDRLVLAEFDRTGAITPSVPLIDLVKARRLTWFYDRYLQPLLYWYSILKGRVRR